MNSSAASIQSVITCLISVVNSAEIRLRLIQPTVQSHLLQVPTNQCLRRQISFAVKHFVTCIHVAKREDDLLFSLKLWSTMTMMSLLDGRGRLQGLTLSSGMSR